MSVDVIGVVDSVMEISTFTRRDGKEATKRALTLRDASGRSVELTLWDAAATEPGDRLAAAVAAGQHPVLAAKGARVGDFNGKTLSAGGAGSVFVDPVDPPEVRGCVVVVGGWLLGFVGVLEGLECALQALVLGV